MGARATIIILNKDTNKAFSMYSHWGAGYLNEIKEAIQTEEASKIVAEVTEINDLAGLKQIHGTLDEVANHNSNPIANKYESISDFFKSPVLNGDEGALCAIVENNKVVSVEALEVNAFAKKFIDQQDRWGAYEKYIISKITKQFNQTENNLAVSYGDLVARNTFNNEEGHSILKNESPFVVAKDIKEAIFDYLVNCNGMDVEEYGKGNNKFSDWKDMMDHTSLFKVEKDGVIYFKIETQKGDYKSINLDWADDKEFTMTQLTKSKPKGIAR